MVISKWRIKSWINCWSDLIQLKSTHICCLESSHMFKMAMLKEKIKINMIDTLTWWRSKAMAFGLKEINSSGSNFIFIWSWVNRYVVLLRGMHHVDRYVFISAQANLCEVWVRETRYSNPLHSTLHTGWVRYSYWTCPVLVVFIFLSLWFSRSWVSGFLVSSGSSGGRKSQQASKVPTLCVD